MSDEAMKLNMIVVMTIWLPRRACSHAGRKAQPAPKAAERTMAAGMTRAVGQPAAPRQKSPTPRPPRYAWPSAPMLKSPPWKATATASPVKKKLVA